MENKLSFSVFFQNARSKTYRVAINVNDSSIYYLSNYQDFEIYYQLPLIESKSYQVLLVGENNNEYYNVNIADCLSNENFIESNVMIGKGENNFPYKSQLKNVVPNAFYIIFFVAVFIVGEMIILIIIFSKKQQKNKIRRDVNTDGNTINNLQYSIEDYKDENE